MKNIGILLILGGVGSFLLELFGYEFRVLMWIEMWGEPVAMAIRGAMVVAGGVLVFLGMRSEGSEAPVEAPAAPPQMSPETETPAQMSAEPEAPAENR